MNVPSLHRREFFRRGAAVASVTIVPAWLSQAAAKAPLAGSQVISVHRMKLGSFEVTAMLDEIGRAHV